MVVLPLYSTVVAPAVTVPCSTVSGMVTVYVLGAKVTATVAFAEKTAV